MEVELSPRRQRRFEGPGPRERNVLALGGGRGRGHGGSADLGGTFAPGAPPGAALQSVGNPPGAKTGNIALVEARASFSGVQDRPEPSVGHPLGSLSIIVKETSFFGASH